MAAVIIASAAKHRRRFSVAARLEEMEFQLTQKLPDDKNRVLELNLLSLLNGLVFPSFLQHFSTQIHVGSVDWPI